MVTQPAYLKNLKAYARERVDSDEDIDEAMTDYSTESDRGVVILSATLVEDTLEDAIIHKLPALWEDNEARKRMFDHDGQISTFSRKIEMAYALGIIDKTYRKEIDLIREIRNACAHSRKPLSMKTDVLRAACEGLIPEMLPALLDRRPETLRNAFQAKCGFITHFLATGERLDTIEKHLKHFEKLNAEYPPSDAAPKNKP